MRSCGAAPRGGRIVDAGACDDRDRKGRQNGHVTRGENETAEIHLKGRVESLPVYLHPFRQM